MLFLKKHRLEFLRFCCVGALGFGVDAGMLERLVADGFSPMIARAGSLLFAMQITYLLHGRFTYRSHAGYGARSWAQFMATNLIGAAINYGVFLLALLLLQPEPAARYRLMALACGTGVALLFNFAANRRFAFATREPRL